MNATASAGAEAERVTTEILDDLLARRHLGIVVDSPPGAGKSTLVVRAARTLVATGEPVMIVAQTNEQVDDLVVRLAGADLGTALIGRLSRTGYVPPPRLDGIANLMVSSDVVDLSACAVTVSTSAKWAHVKDRTWPWAIVDEAYQMRSDYLLAIARRFERALFVGDPGQLDPFSTVENDRWRGLSWDPMQSAVAVLLRNNPDLPVHRLPVSWRLPASAEAVVAKAFYPFTGFRAGSAHVDRELRFTAGTASGTTVDAVLDEAAVSGWGLYELPSRYTIRTDPEAVRAVAAITRRLVERRAVARSGSEEHEVTPDRIAVGAAHRDQVAALSAALEGLPVVVDTANRLQGREYDVTVVLHPLSGRRDATAFHLEAGRLCVLTSRHRQACIVVARAGIADLLDAHPSTEPVHLDEPVSFPDGWAANQTVLAHLADHRVVARDEA
ncbi:AAA family ATPase [Virgisporangium ochraceum]|uniref:Helicase n=1 Tax=Virgisporangium ochraceum TaxID=65505 RepID=A0A8J3ZV38_9ACTN|nr:AAA family ATPase [Virgisporangium ochraceum]GIJ69015.1 helicase [Virgisporangium ochraceum]